MLDHVNLFFTIIFTAELVVVAFSSWFMPFISDMWCWLDMFVVGMSLISLVLTNEPTGIARVMRALRVLRLFGRLKSLRKILTALALAIVPVCQVFLILFILLCVGALLCVPLVPSSSPLLCHSNDSRVPRTPAYFLHLSGRGSIFSSLAAPLPSIQKE